MFILRRITSNGIQTNTFLGDEYVLVDRETNEQEFNERTELWKDSDIEKDLYGLVCYDNGESIMPLYKKSRYYIMANDGKTFENISNRK